MSVFLYRLGGILGRNAVLVVVGWVLVLGCRGRPGRHAR